MGCPANKFTYKRHEPETTLLYKVLQEHLETWLAERQADTSRSPLPSFVEKELRAFMRCGILYDYASSSGVAIEPAPDAAPRPAPLMSNGSCDPAWIA